MDLTAWLARCPLLAILRGIRPAEAAQIGETLVAAGIAIIEVPLNSPEPFASIRILADRLPDTLVGAGTVRSGDDVARVHGAGGRLIVTPHADTAVTRAAKSHGMIACPGFLTPTEAFALLDAGADGLKLFPAEAASPAVLRALRAVLPRVPVLPVGGIDHTNMGPWLDAGADGFGLGSALFRPGDDAAMVAAKASRLMRAIRPTV